MADRLISINTELPPGSQLPVAVREELAQYSALNPTAEVTGAYAASVNDMVLVAASAATTVTLPAGADGTRVVGVHIVSGESAVTLQTSGADTLIAPGNGITSLALAGPEVNVGLSVWRHDAAGACWHPISLTALPAVDDLVDASMLGRTMLTSTTAAEIRSLLGAVAAEDVADLFGTSWEPPVYAAKAATGYTAYVSVTSGTKTLSGFTTTAGAFEVVTVFGYRSAGASMAFTVTSGGVEMIPASDVIMGGGVGPTSGNASFAQVFINPDASGSAHDIVVSWESSASCSPNISVGVMSFTGVSTYGAADVKTGSESGTAISHTVSSAPERVVANVMWHEPLTGTGIISYSGLQGQSVPAGSYGQASQGYADGVSAVTFTGTRASGADYGSIAVQLTGSVTYENAAVLLEDTTVFTQDLLTAADAAAARSKLSAAELVGGKLPVSQLPTTAMEYKGIWDASANTPTLADGAGDAGDMYRVSVAGTRDLGSGSATYGVGDLVLYDGSVWQRSESAPSTVFMTGACGTAAATAAKEVTLDAPWASRTPVDGDWLFITFTNGQTAPYPITLDANGSGAKIVTQVGYGDPQVATVVFAGGGMLLRFMGSAYACTPQASGNASVMTGTCSTAAGTADKTVTLDDPWSSGSVSLQETSLIAVRYTSGQTAAAPTLAVNGMAAMPIYGPRGDTNAGSLTVGANSIAYYRYTSVPSNRLIALSGAPEIADADITAAAGTVTGLVSGRRAEALLAGEATKTRTLSSKTLVAPTVSAVNQSAAIGADLTPAGGLGDAGWVKSGGAAWSSPDLTVPSGGTVSCSIPVVSGTVYVVDMVRSAYSGGNWQVSIGGASGSLPFSYQSMTVTATETGTVTLTVGGGTWAGTIQNITCKPVTAWASPLADLGGQHVRAPGSTNLAVGNLAGQRLVGGSSNTAFGDSALRLCRDANSNTAVGYQALRDATGSDNTAVGSGALRGATTGGSNTAVGSNAAFSLTTGINNVYLGLAAGYTPNGNAAWASTTASQQTVIGREAGQGSATASDSIIAIGYRTVADGVKATAVGTQANCGHAGSVALGSDTATTSTGQVAVGPRDIEVQDSAKGVVLKSPDGSRWRIKIDNAGTISGTKL